MTRSPSDQDARGAGRVRRRLEEAGYPLPVTPEPVGTYVAARRDGDVIRLSGHTDRGRVGTPGHEPLGPGSDLTLARTAARFAVANLISATAGVVEDLDAIADVVHLRGYVRSTPDFVQHPQVIDAASELLNIAFEPAQSHTRAAVGVSSLPGGALVELEAILRVRSAD